MTILSTLRDRLPGHDVPAQSRSAGDTQGDPVSDAQLPFAGYDRLGERQVIDALSDHSQIELEAVDDYERSHENRVPVLDKLRWMRGREPLPGYDALSVDGIVAALQDADPTTITKVRGYERKFANRADVLEEVVRVHHRRRVSQPASPAPSYQPMSDQPMSASATSPSSAPVDRPEPSGGP